MKYYTWDLEKNEKLKAERGVSFEQVVLCIEQGGILDILEHRDPQKYRGQRIFVIRIDDYAFLVPFLEDDEQVVLKTIIPSRKATKTYLRKEVKDDEA